MRDGADISEEELQGAVMRLMADDYFKQLRSAKERQVYVQKMLGVDRRSIDGIGQPVLEIDPVLYHAAARIEEDSKGEAQYGVWRDPVFLRRMREEGVVQEVKSKGVKEISVGYTGAGDMVTRGAGDQVNNRRFRKSYG